MHILTEPLPVGIFQAYEIKADPPIKFQVIATIL